MLDFQTINEMTGFANGDKFKTDEEVYEYFTPENMEGMFGETLDAEELEKMAYIVIENRWHMVEA